ncbi:hypothetical protein Emed_007430 [Eimeria media]
MSLTTSRVSTIHNNAGLWPEYVGGVVAGKRKGCRVHLEGRVACTRAEEAQPGVQIRARSERGSLSASQMQKGQGRQTATTEDRHANDPSTPPLGNLRPTSSAERQINWRVPEVPSYIPKERGLCLRLGSEAAGYDSLNR